MHLTKYAIITLFVAFLGSGFAGLLIGLDRPAFEERERREPTTFPILNPRMRTPHFKNFFAGIDQWLTDRIGGRSYYHGLFQLGSLYPEAFAWNKPTITGKEGWIFLSNKIDNYISYTQNKRPVPEGLLQSTWEFYQLLHDACSQAGVPLVIFIAPNKSTIYPEYLPDWAVPQNTWRMADRLLAEGPQRGLTIVFPRKELEDAKQHWERLYFSDDSHWNVAGAQIGLQALWKGLQQVVLGLPWLSALDAPLLSDNTPRIGDLARMAPSAYDTRDSLNWQQQLPGNKPYTSLRILLFHDSFGEAWNNFFQAAVTEVVKIHQGSVKKELLSALQRVKPDVVIFECVERTVLHDKEKPFVLAY